MEKNKLTGAQIFVQSLLDEGVEAVFGYPGGQVLPIFDAMHGSKLNFILTRHEQGSAHMADGYARASGKTGVCLATSGPGATNTVTGIATAYMDSVPMVVFTGQVATNVIGNDAFQEADITGITRPITKHNYLVKDVKDLARTIKEAFYVAASGRPGPVLVDIPVDVQRGVTEYHYPKKVDIPSYKPNYTPNARQIAKVAEAIKNCARPVLYVGGGVVSSGAGAQVLALAKKCAIPVTNTLLAKGVFPSDNALSLGMLGMHGTYQANKAMQNADLIIAAGARFDDRCTGKVCAFAQNAKIVHIDIDPTSISKVVETSIPVVADVKNALEALVKAVDKKTGDTWLKQIKEWATAHPLTYDKTDGKLHPQYILETVNSLTKGEAIVATEVGSHQMWAAQYYMPKSARLFLSSGGLGTMGFGFPAGIGAKVACPDKQVIIIAGDGSFQMNVQELATAVMNSIDVKVIVFNNHYLGNVRQWQEMFYGKRYSSTCLSRRKECPQVCNTPDRSKCPVYLPDFVKLAQAYGATGIRINKKDEVESAIKKMLETKGTVVVDAWIEQETNVFPMVPPNASLDDIMTRMNG
jgi:acetolactate synthase-1/2/3 large subunit